MEKARQSDNVPAKTRSNKDLSCFLGDVEL